MQSNGGRPWRFVADMNFDGLVTVSDTWLWFKWLYFYPGDLLLLGLMRGAAPVAIFFEISDGSFGGEFSGVVSFFAWLVVFILVRAVLLGARGMLPKSRKSPSRKDLGYD